MDKALGHPGGEVVAGSGLEGANHLYAASWRRGIMHVIERMDLLFAKPVPKSRAQEKVAEVKALLDELTQFSRDANPSSYEDAFEISQRDYHRAAAALGFAWATGRPDRLLKAQPHVAPPASEDSRAELNRLAERVKELEGALANYRRGVIEAFDALCPACRGKATIPEHTRSALNQGVEK